MAESLRYVCNHCDRAIEAWSDGNPYYINKSGAKQYAYHPDEELSYCIGTDSPHLCLDCGKEFMVDSRSPAKACIHCGSSQFIDKFKLEGSTCPYCKIGQFYTDPDFFCIS